MLTGDLLAARTYKGKIEPVYAAITSDNIELAEAIIDVFRINVGKTYGALIEELKSFEEMNFRLIRGWIQLLERRCVIEQDAIVEPAAARKAVFDECRGMALADERQRTIDSVAKKLLITPQQLENVLWADYEENLIVKSFEPITAENLLRQYNLSLVQTLLFKAMGLEFKIQGNFQNVFRKIKQLGLLYNIENDMVFLDGPLSLFKMTERYGTSLAKLLPEIMRADKWSIKASILKRAYGDKRIFEFALDDSKKIFGADSDSDSAFDSAIEEEFARHDFGGWKVKREPALLKAGQYAFIPDFSIENETGATKIYVEIVGFWTPEYLQKKIQKVNQVKETLMLLVDKNLACSGSEFKINLGNVIFFDKKIPYSEIAKVLGAYDEKRLAGEIEKLKYVEIPLHGAVIDIAKAAVDYGASAKALHEILKRRHGGYLLFESQLVSQETMNAIRHELEGVTKYKDAAKILEKYGITAHNEALVALGYKIRWAGLNPENAEIVKIELPLCR